MNPILAKLIILLVMIIMFALFLSTGYMFYKVVIKPFFIRLTQYRKVLYVAQIILTSKNKIEKLIELGITDKEVIRITEEELVTSKKFAADMKILDTINQIWRKIQDGKKPTSKRTNSGSENKGKIGKEQTGSKGGESKKGNRFFGKPRGKATK